MRAVQCSEVCRLDPPLYPLLRRARYLKTVPRR